MPAKEMALLHPIQNVHNCRIGGLDDVVVDDEPVVVQDDRVRRALQPLQRLVDVGRDSHHGLALVQKRVAIGLKLGADVDPRHGLLSNNLIEYKISQKISSNIFRNKIDTKKAVKLPQGIAKGTFMILNCLPDSGTAGARARCSRLAGC